MKNCLRIAIAQINPIVGAIEQNSRKIIEYAYKARKNQADVVIFPELALCGYPPEDLLHKPSFIDENLKIIKLLAKSIDGITAIVGFVDRVKSDVYNAAALISNKKIKGVYHKNRLPNYGVFDEKRYFEAGKDPLVFKIGKITCGINICEDIRHIDGPTAGQAKLGCDIIFAINASPFYAGKFKERKRILTYRAKKYKVFIAYANLVGGQDELVFDGRSLVIDNKGRLLEEASAFKDDLLIADLEIPSGKKSYRKAVSFDATLKKKTIPISKRPKERLSQLDEVYKALVLGLRDYVYKNRFEKVVLGLSGGIDSALTAKIAEEALGRINVIGLFMPSEFTSRESLTCTRELVRRLGIRLYDVPINNIVDVYQKNLSRLFKGYPKDKTEENLQARIRANLLMAVSNKMGYLVLTTGNKSEVSCGYCTLYGDMAGGFSIIKDVPKTLVYRLAKEIVNKSVEIIPKRILTRPPTAELKRRQKDTDTLPPYDVLDPIVEAYVENDKQLKDIAKKGNKEEVVEKVIRMIDANEYKRRQAAPGIKITPKAFGKDRRMPITNRFF